MKAHRYVKQNGKKEEENEGKQAPINSHTNKS